MLSNSKQLLVDEKARFRNKKGYVYEDIAIEIWSDHDRRVFGWGLKPIRADFIAYAILPLGKAYLLPVPALQRATRRNVRRWVEATPWVKSSNESDGWQWETWSVAIPVEELFRAMGEAMMVAFEPTEEAFK